MTRSQWVLFSGAVIGILIWNQWGGDTQSEVSRARQVTAVSPALAPTGSPMKTPLRNPASSDETQDQSKESPKVWEKLKPTPGRPWIDPMLPDARMMAGFVRPTGRDGIYERKILLNPGSGSDDLIWVEERFVVESDGSELIEYRRRYSGSHIVAHLTGRSTQEAIATEAKNWGVSSVRREPQSDTVIIRIANRLRSDPDALERLSSRLSDGGMVRAPSVDEVGRIDPLRVASESPFGL